jgi:hypothetical protein
MMTATDFIVLPALPKKQRKKRNPGMGQPAGCHSAGKENRNGEINLLHYND